MKKTLFLVITLFASIYSYSQTKRVLFLGNSYTQVNNLPQLVVSVAQSTNDIIIVDSNTPGGHTFEQHSTNATSIAKINQGNWDFVVLQEQSQLPSFPINQVETEVFPFAQSLNNLIVSQNPCAETVLYMTWGRQNGDSQNCPFFPPLCTYEGMDDLLRERYLTMTTDNNAIVSPVGAVWRYLRLNNPSLELYSSDESHPSLLGSYAAACTFYSTITRKDPTAITFNSTLSSSDANAIKLAVKNVVFDHLLDWKIGSYDPNANFSFSNLSSSEISFTNNSTNASQYNWDFGDGTTSNEVNPSHNYAAEGNYNVTLTVSKCGVIDTEQHPVIISNLSNNQWNSENNDLLIFPNPVTENLNLISDGQINLVTIYDINGRLLDYIENKSNQKSIDFTNKEAGFYILKVHSKGTIFTKKIIKK
jgi:PKD repeat protein